MLYYSNLCTLLVIMAKLAHPTTRFHSHCIDGVITLLLFSGCIGIQQYFALTGSLSDLFISLIPASYYLLSDALPNGQSLGKRWMNIQVVHYQTLQPCQAWQSLLRKGVIPIFGLLDTVFIFLKEHRRAGDYLAHTIVITQSDGRLPSHQAFNQSPE